MKKSTMLVPVEHRYDEMNRGVWCKIDTGREFKEMFFPERNFVKRGEDTIIFEHTGGGSGIFIHNDKAYTFVKY